MTFFLKSPVDSNGTKNNLMLKKAIIALRLASFYVQNDLTFIFLKFEWHNKKHSLKLQAQAQQRAPSK